MGSMDCVVTTEDTSRVFLITLRYSDPFAYGKCNNLEVEIAVFFRLPSELNPLMDTTGYS